MTGYHGICLKYFSVTYTWWAFYVLVAIIFLVTRYLPVDKNENWILKMFLEKGSLKKISGQGVGEMAQGLRVLTSFPEDLGWISRSHMASYNSL